MDKISFQGLTHFAIDANKYKKLRVAAESSCHRIRKDSKAKVHKNQYWNLETSPKNITVLGKNNFEGFQIHIPIKNNIEKYLLELTKKVEKLKSSAKGESLTMWLIGGTKIRSAGGDTTVKTLNKIADITCDKPDIDASILVGSHTGEEKFIVHPVKNILNLIYNKNVKSKNTEAELRNIFDIVELNNIKL